MSDSDSNLGDAEAPQKLLKRTIFNNIQAKDPPVRPRSGRYHEEVMAQVLSHHNMDETQLGLLNAPSYEDLKSQVNNFVGYIRSKYDKRNISGNAKTFRKKYDATFLAKEFHWIPDFKLTEGLDEDSVLQPNFSKLPRNWPRYVFPLHEVNTITFHVLFST